MASLFVIRGRDQGKRFDLDGEPASLGREGSNRIQLHDTEVSRRHAEVRRNGDAFTLVDLKSSNGTFVNAERVEEQVLRSGDRVGIGRTLMIFTATDDAVESARPENIDIVSSDPRPAESRIVRSISQAEGSRIFDTQMQAESPWLARARSNLQVMYRTALAVSHTLDIDELLQRILELVFEWVEADRGCFMLVDPETDELTPAVRRDRRPDGAPEQLTISRTILDYVTTQNEGVLTSDAQEDDRWDAGKSIVSAGVREAICVPMQGRYGVVGVIYIDTYTPPDVLNRRSPQRFTEEHLKLMVAIGHQAALAVEDTSYYSAMVQAERLAAIGQTIATLSHHIKNILQGIRGGSFLIEEGLKNEESEIVRRGWAIVDKNQEKISNLVMDMLSFSKERKPVLEQGDLNSVAADVVELMQRRAADAGVNLRFEPERDLPPCSFDADAMHRAVLNIVTNAIDACESVPADDEETRRAAGEVIVRTQQDAERGRAQILIADNGEGIPAEDLRKIFSLFESRKGARGTGLGLAVSQKILREHQGEIHVESEPGVGSCFVLEIPSGDPGGMTGRDL